MRSFRSDNHLAHRHLEYVEPKLGTLIGSRNESSAILRMRNMKVINTNNKVIDNVPKLGGRQAVVFCDFDGTVTTTDVTDVLLEKLAHPDWKVIEERWVNGEIDDCQCMGEQIALIEGNWQKIVRVLDTIKIDPYFKLFVAQCKKANLPIYIGSNGLDRVISYILDRENIQIDGSWSYHLVESDKGWALEFPKDRERGFCRVSHSIACKCTLLEPVKLAHITEAVPYKIVIGDSKSDFCWANKADFVFGKKKLAKYCGERDIDYLPFSDFSHICEYMTKYELLSQAA